MASCSGESFVRRRICGVSLMRRYGGDSVDSNSFNSGKGDGGYANDDSGCYRYVVRLSEVVGIV